MRVVCSPNYPESNPQEQYNIVESGLLVSTLFIQLSHSGHDFQKDQYEHKILVVYFSKILSQTLHISSHHAKYL